MLRSLFCGACFSYIIPPPVTVCQVIFGIFCRRMQKNRSDQEKIVSSVKPDKKGRCTSFPAAALLFCAIFIHSPHVPFSSFVCSCSPLAACIRPAVTKPTLTPTKKKHKPNHQFHGFFLLLCFSQFTTFYLSDGVKACRAPQIFLPGRAVFLLQCCRALPHLLYCCQYATIL